MKTKRKNIKKNKLDVWLKCGEIEKYIKAKKTVRNITFNAPNLFFDLSCVVNANIKNCKFNVLDVHVLNNQANAIYKNCWFYGNRISYGYTKSDLVYYKNRKKFKNKGLKCKK